MTEDGGEQVVEVMGHPPREAPDAVELLRLEELLLEATPLGDVLCDDDDPHDVSLNIELRELVGLNPSLVARDLESFDDAQLGLPRSNDHLVVCVVRVGIFGIPTG